MVFHRHICHVEPCVLGCLRRTRPHRRDSNPAHRRLQSNSQNITAFLQRPQRILARQQHPIVSPNFPNSLIHRGHIIRRAKRHHRHHHWHRTRLLQRPHQQFALLCRARHHHALPLQRIRAVFTHAPGSPHPKYSALRLRSASLPSSVPTPRLRLAVQPPFASHTALHPPSTPPLPSPIHRAPFAPTLPMALGTRPAMPPVAHVLQ